ncbi:MAG: bifunctional riboflavin kinase/FAD synthetase [Myxococcota bacterium]
MSGDRDALVVIGNFDGVHQGHQALLARVGREAAEQNLRPRLLTFEPHPAVTLGRGAPARLSTLARKLELIERACPGIDVVVKAFTRAFAGLSPQAFVREVVLDELRARMVVVGENFRFGKGRAGGIDELKSYGRTHGFEARAERLVSDEAGAWSSSRVREHIAAGDMPSAAAILGRPHMLSGRVAPGDRRGRTIGFPTCNLPDVTEALPPHGVYAVLVDRATTDVETSREKATVLGKGVANLGVRPTVKEAQPAPLLEVHLLDHEGDLYGEHLRVHVVANLRRERRFDGVDALRAQIARDVAAAREALHDAAPRRDGAWA